MIGETRIIIAITKAKIIAAKVRTKGPGKIREFYEYGWKEATLDIVFSKIKEKFEAKKVRILIGEDQSYVLRMKVPQDLSGIKERQYIAEKISEEIPEQLTDRQWDFKELRFDYPKGSKRKGNEKEVVVFAPLRGLFENLSAAVEKTGLIVEAIEPEVISKTRNSNPLIGLALKTDIKGKDEDVLNLKPAFEIKAEEGDEAKVIASELLEEEKQKAESKIKGFKAFIFIILILAIAVIGTMIFFYQRKISQLRTESLASPAPTLAPTPTPKEVVQEEPKVVDILTYSIQVLNGSGVAGRALEIEEILIDEGFETLETSNADSFDYQDITISTKSDVSEDFYSEIKALFEDEYLVNLSSNALSDDSQFDAVLIVGESSK